MDFSNYENFKKFQGLNILSVDYGEKVVGLATFCPGREPFPLGRGRIINKGVNFVISEIGKIIDEDFIEVLVIGIPYFTDGKESEKTIEMKGISKKIQDKFPSIKVIEQDETLTTQTAKDRMLNSAQYNFQIDLKKIDEVSAIIILEDFIRAI